MSQELMNFQWEMEKEAEVHPSSDILVMEEKLANQVRHISKGTVIPGTHVPYHVLESEFHELTLRYPEVASTCSDCADPFTVASKA